MRLILAGFLVFFFRRFSYEIEETVNQHKAEEQRKAQEGQAKAP